MTPTIWLYKNDEVTLKAIQRPTEAGVEVLVVGSGGERAHHTFHTDGEAHSFHQSLHAMMARRGFKLAWQTTGAALAGAAAPAERGATLGAR